MKKPLIIHPFLLSVFPALSLVSDHIALIFINRAVLAIALIMLSVTSLCFFLLRFIVKNEQKAASIVSLSLLLFSSYGHVFDFLSLHFKKIVLSHRYLLWVWSVLEILVVRFFLKASSNLDTFTNFLNIMATSLVTMSLVHIVINKTSGRYNGRILKPLENANTKLRDSNTFRDIYYIIVDGHASSSTLREIYHYNNHEVINKLKKKGFFIAERSRSNYAMTMLSLASSLNMEYVNPLSNIVGANRQGIHAAKQLIEDNFTMRFLKSQGYKIIFLGSGFGITQRNRHADVEMKSGVVDETLGRFIQSTLIRAVADKTHLIEKEKRKRILRMFSQLAEVHKLKGPKFVFAHIASPQWPFLFDANGNPTHWDKLDTEQKKEAYLNQLIFIDKKIENLIDEILTRSEVDPIIILQSDHGPNFAFDGGYMLQNPPQEILLEKMRILNAYYLPDGESNFLYESVTPVNTFRLIFNRYFGSNFPLLEDQSYFSTLDYPYRLINVTHLVQNN